MNKQNFLYGILFFLFGVFLQNTLFSFLLSLFFAGLCFLILSNFALFYKVSLLKMLSFLGLFLAGCYVSFLSITTVQNTEMFLKQYFLESEYEVEYEVLDVYKKRDFDIDYEVGIKKIGEVDVSSEQIRAIVRAPRNYELFPQQVWKSKTKFYSLQGNIAIQYYFYSQGIFLRMYPYNFLFVGKEEVNFLTNFIQKFRETFLETLESMYPKEEASLLEGILVGERGNMSLKLQDSFNRAGLTHIVAVSGFNVTVLIIFSSIILGIFPSFIQVVGVSVASFFFVVLVGPSMPVLRATIMGLIGYIVMHSGRKVDTIVLLLASLSSIVFFSPLSLNYDISLQLSFGATLGIVLLSPLFEKLKRKFSSTFFILEGAYLTVCALVLTLPILLSNFGQISLVSPLTNVLVIWNIPLIMLFGFLSVVSAGFSNILGLTFSYITFLFLKFDIFVAGFFSSFPLSVLQLDIASFKILFYFLYYSVVAIILYRLRRAG